MSDTNLTAVLKKIGEIYLENMPIPEPGPGEVQLCMQQDGICGSDVHYWQHVSICDFVLKAPMVLGHEASGLVSKLGEGVTSLKDEVQLCMQQVGICGSDVHFWQHGRVANYIVEAPMILGHESSGVVSKLGKGVTSLKVGDRVAIEPGVPCRECKYCKVGRYNLCPDEKFCATPPHDGNLARYYVHAADFCFKLPDNVSFEEGALLEPLSVGVHACSRGGVALGSRVLVCGAGPIGLVNLLIAKAAGASQVCITDIDQNRLEMAKKLGADYTILVKKQDSKDIARLIEEAMGEGPDIAIECSGVASSVQTAIYATRSGGCVVLVGLGQTESMNLPVVNAAVREVDIRGSLRYANCYPKALAMIASGKVDIKPLITHRFTLEDTIKAFETTLRGEGIKVMINCSR